MSGVQIGRFLFRFSLRFVPYLLVPGTVLTFVSIVAFRGPAVILLPAPGLADSLALPQGWQMPPAPADNPITTEKFVLGRQLFFEVGLSGDGKTSCGSCHNPRLIFSAGGAHGGAFGDTARPARMVPKLANVAYDTILTWDGHIHTLEEQVHIAVLRVGDLQCDTTTAFPALEQNMIYRELFGQAFGDPTITLDRIAQAIATFERCLISANSPYDQYLNGDNTALSASAIRGMNLFFDTTQTNCSFCHNNLGPTNPNAPGQTFTDNNYYRTGVFESRNRGYGFDTLFEDAGRAAVTHDSADLGKFRTPTLRNLALTPPYGADGFVFKLSDVLSNYNHGGAILINDSEAAPQFNQDPRVKPLHLDSTQLSDLAAFLNSLTDLSFISNPQFQDSTFVFHFGGGSVDDRLVSGNLSVYPNPAPGFINVESPELSGEVRARLISEGGATVWQRSEIATGRSLHFDFAGIPNGAYQLEVQVGNVRTACKIVLER